MKQEIWVKPKGKTQALKQKLKIAPTNLSLKKNLKLKMVPLKMKQQNPKMLFLMCGIFYPLGVIDGKPKTKYKVMRKHMLGVAISMYFKSFLSYGQM